MAIQIIIGIGAFALGVFCGYRFAEWIIIKTIAERFDVRERK